MEQAQDKTSAAGGQSDSTVGLERLRVAAGIELEYSFESGSKWAVGDEELAALVAATREECARHLELTRSDIRLLAGEMTAQEMRTVMAVLSAIWKRMRSNVEVTGARAPTSEKN